MENEERQIIETIDEDGNVINFELYDSLNKEGEDYLFETIEDEDEFNKVEEYIKTMDDEEDEEE